MRDWLSFWNAPNRIYVNDLHRDVHYRDVALEIRSLVPSPSATVVDYGCGEATAAHLVAEAAGALILSDGAPGVRDKLAARFRDNAKITVRSPEEVAALPPGTVDLIVLNSVAQYLDHTQFAELLALFKRLLAADGRLVVGDVIPPHTSAVGAIVALMTLAWRHGFVGPALLGLIRTLFSDYRRLRNRLGLTHYSEAEMLEALSRAGFAAHRRYPNLEHNQERMTFVATVIADGSRGVTAPSEPIRDPSTPAS
ncbi:MAG: class I SAM-dependent methyltransferase [Xanthobacteraceae bacterium]